MSGSRGSGGKLARDHVYLCSLFWDGLWIIQQPICNEIQKEEPVLFVERPVSIFTVVRYPRLWRRLFTWMRGARQVSTHLRLLAPLPLFHLGHRFPRLFRWEFALQRQWILWWAGRSPKSTRMLWFDNPLYECAIGQLGDSLSVYHVGDEMREFPSSDPQTVSALEERALRRVSVVFAAADELARVRVAQNPRTFAIWNAIDTAVFTAEVLAEEVADVDRLPRPRVAFIGVLDSWVDVDLLCATAVALPDVSIVVVGPSRIDDAALRAISNVTMLGTRHRRIVPGILRRASANLVPFRSNALTRNIVPAKVFEALAAGIVPVCTAFSRNLDVLEEKRLAFVARTPTEFVELVRQAIREDTPARRAEIAGFGMQQTWSSRWTQMKGILTTAERALA